MNDHDDIDILASSTTGKMLPPRSVGHKNNQLYGITLINCQTPILYPKLNVDIVVLWSNIVMEQLSCALI